jgi:hypothetical protein
VTVGSTASGRSFAMIASTMSTVGGSTYAVGHLQVGHDRRRVAVDEDHLEAFSAQRLAGLRARVIELACPITIGPEPITRTLLSQCVWAFSAVGSGGGQGG